MVYTNGNRIYTIGGRAVYQAPDPYNPLGLPPHTIRAKFIAGYTPAMGDSQTLVDATDNVWDIYKSSDDWSGLFGVYVTGSDSLLEVIGANTTGVRDMTGMFSGCTSLTSVPLFDTSSVVLDMRGMFNGCTSLTQVPLFDTSSVTDMSAMFYGCTSLTQVPLFDTSSVTSMNQMFYGCTLLTTIPLFNTSSVADMALMFRYCISLTSVPLFDTSSVTGMNQMFEYCTSLTQVPLFDLSSVTSMTSMFNGCTSLTQVPLFDLSSVTSMIRMFNGCTNVTGGALALYQRASAKSLVPSHVDTFKDCGKNTQTGAAELAQIPSSWGGTMG